jgi:hypothetical protein
MTDVPLRSNKKAVRGSFLSSNTQVPDHSGSQREATRPDIPQINLKNIG